MRAVLEDADRLGIRLSLEARSCAGPEQGKLEAWYGRFGFLPTGETLDFGPVLARPAASRRERRAA